eukprot:4163407-Prymnesium_polylepis.2
MASTCVVTPPTPNGTDVLLALGIISAPKNIFRRQWLRDTVFRFGSDAIVMRFVLGLPAGTVVRRRAKADGGIACDALADEVAIGDTIVLNATDNAAVGCVDKAFAWYTYAVGSRPARAGPRARGTRTPTKARVA